MVSNELVDRIENLPLKEETEPNIKYLLGNALLRRAVDDIRIRSEEEEEDRLPTEQRLQDSIERILLTFLSPNRPTEGKRLPHGLNMSFDLVTSVLCLKSTKSGDLDHRRRSTRMIEKLLPWVMNDKQVVVKKGALVNESQDMSLLSEIQQSSDSFIQRKCTTYSQCVYQFLSEHARETLRSAIFSDQNVLVREQNVSINFEFLLAPLFVLEWNTYKQIKSSDAAASERALKLLHSLLICIMTVLWARYCGQIETKIFWNYWYVFVVIAGALCVILDAQYRRACACTNIQATGQTRNAHSGILHILSEKFTTVGSSVCTSSKKFSIDEHSTVFVDPEQLNEIRKQEENVDLTEDESELSTDLLNPEQIETILHQAIQEDNIQFRPQSASVLAADTKSYDFTKPCKRFDSDVAYDSAFAFFQDLGFNDVTIDRLKPHFPTLKGFVDYDVFALIEQLETDILADEDNMDKYIVNNKEDFFQMLRLFGFRNEWAQTYTWAMGDAYADQLVKHSIEECLRLRLSSPNTIQPFPNWTSNLQNNHWQTYSNPQFKEGQNFYVLKQDRSSFSDFGHNLDEINFADLTNRTRLNHRNPQYWFHATNWTGAENIMRNGVTGKGENTNFSRGPAYYLNNDYRDCYQYFSRREHKFFGEQAIFIYEFDPKSLSDGRYIFFDEETAGNVKKWQQMIFSCMNDKQKEVGDLNGCRCVSGWECDNTNEVRHKRATQNTPQRRPRITDGKYAEQLAIRSNRMWPRIDENLIGVVIFEHC